VVASLTRTVGGRTIGPVAETVHPDHGGQRFLGRDRELAALCRTIDGARCGQVRFLVLEGEAGGGKSTLLNRAIADHARPSGCAVLAGHAEPNDHRAFAAIAGALDCRVTSPHPLRARIGELLRTGPTPGAALTSAVEELVVELVERVALDRPTLVVIDDLHWADEPSIALLGSLVKRLRGADLAVLGAARPSRSTRSAVEASGGEWLSLGPLTDHEIEELAAFHTGRRPDEALMASLRAVSSNPLLIATIAAGSVPSDDVAVASRRARLLHAFVGRAGELPTDVRAVLDVAAVAGRSVDVDALAGVTGMPVARVVVAVRELERRSWFSITDAGVEFRHDLFAEALNNALPVSDRDLLHLRLGRAFASLGHAPGRAAFHLDAASYLLVPQDVPLLVSVLGALPPHDPLARSLAARAQELDANDEAAVLALLRCLGASHRHTEAIELVRSWDAHRPPDARHDVAIAMALSTSLAATGASEAAITHLDSLLRSRVLEPQQQADVLNAITRLHWYRWDAAVVLDAAERALSVARSAGSRPAEVRALCSRSEAASMLGDVDTALADAELADTIAARDGGDATAASLALGIALSCAGRMRESLTILSRGLRIAEPAGDPHGTALAQVTLQATRFHVGEWDGFVPDAEAMADLSRESGTRTGLVLPLCFAAIVAMRRGDAAGLRSLAARARAEFTLGDTHPATPVGIALLELAELESSGRVVDACVRGHALAAHLEAAGASAQSLVAHDVARLAWQAGDADALAMMRDLAAVTATRSATETRRRGAAFIGVLHEVVASGGHVSSNLLDALASAARDLAETERAWDGATSLHIAGVVTATHGESAAAGELFEHAATRYEILGCTGHAASARAKQGFDGLAGTATGDAPVARSPDALSNAERRVLALIGKGLSNGEIADAVFISKRTVESHVAALYRKLGVTTRVALARHAMAATPTP
jgi:ATP/maltotriose-dependent transcriptional regulator MalT